MDGAIHQAVKHVDMLHSACPDGWCNSVRCGSCRHAPLCLSWWMAEFIKEWDMSTCSTVPVLVDGGIDPAVGHVDMLHCPCPQC